ncbi:uncharacterized protein LOC130673377 [Microplitis mediator]|uniref:uncharacterized protein LOC130673377 n=1 Tax=Microplitis mediator TaxID=375433 RepID=UPI0025563AC2|nr:uncharacterized protein LOC130673377 [Microplitis mediator]
MGSEFEARIIKLYEEGKHEEIIKLSDFSECDEVRRLLWVWPSFNDLKWLKKIITDLKFKGIVSVGCGTGLLEWIIQQYLNCDVIGIEVDEPWWQSKYSPRCYLNKIIFTSKKKPANIPPDYALLFCYFNNSAAFESYLTNYSGQLILVIGPATGTNRHTDPLPFDRKFAALKWKLHDFKKLDNGIDLIAAYIRM